MKWSKMTRILCDTDILSVFAKIDQLNLIDEAFPNAEFLIVEEVYDELSYAEDNGFNFPKKIFKFTETTSLKKEEIKKYQSYRDQPKFLPLSKADLKTFTKAQNREILLISNESHLLEVSVQEKVLALDIYDILKIMYTKETLSKQEIIELAKEIEEKDNLKLPDLDKIWKN